MIETEENRDPEKWKDALMPVKDGSASRARLVEKGCNSFVNLRSGKVWRTTEEKKISTQVWKIPHEKININILRERTEEDLGVYAQEEWSIPTGMGKYIPVQTNHGITGVRESERERKSE